MKFKVSNYLVWFAASLLSIAAIASIAKPVAFFANFQTLDGAEEDTIKKDTTKGEKYKPSRRPNVNATDRHGNPVSDRSKSPLLLPTPSNVTTEVTLDSANNYYIEEKVGDTYYRSPSTMTLDEYSKIQQQNYMRNYWKSKSQGLDGESAVTGRSLIPKIYVGPGFDRIFGGDYVDIQPNGFVSLDFGVKAQRVNNPNYSIRQQRTPPGFDFDQQISMNVTGKIGEKATITSNFDTKSSFQFENNIKFDYTGFEEDIIKKIEIGNVNMPLNNTLMQGAQNLFGIKTQLQFGKLFVTGVASTQRGVREEVKIKGGNQRKNFEIRADNYEDNRHFFLSHYFRENFERALRSLPNPTGGIQIPQNRVEVYVVNRSNNTDALRSIIALTDLGESKIRSKGGNNSGGTNTPSDNKVNELYSIIRTPPDQRSIDALTADLESRGLELGKDYEKITGARRLTERDFTVNSTLGFISLNTPLRNDEALAVAFQYTSQGRPYKVGELTEDYQNLSERQVVILKLLRPNGIRTNSPMWDLMMKNIYSLGASGISRDNFQLRIVYRDDNTGLDNPNLQEGFATKNIPLLQLFNLDILNPNNDPQPDGNFDYIEGLTMDSRYGRVMFPVLEPFGSHLNSKFSDSENELKKKYVFQELYSRTKADATLTPGKNKFFIVGTYQASGSEGVNINAIGISPGSVRVSYAGKPLEENVDYTVDYTTGNVTFLKEEYTNGASDISISYEKDEFFTPVTKTLLGTRFDYRWNKNLNIGGTMLYMNERPMISRISVGDEPVRNMMWGTDISYSKDSRVLTRLVDRLPFIRTKETSNISMMGEFAQLVPGTSNKNGGEGIAYIDDFEGTETPFDLGRQPVTWKLAATPPTFMNNPNSKGLEINNRRAKLAWYTIDQTVFYRDYGNNKPSNIDEDETKNNHYTRYIGFNEVFKGLQETTLPTPQPTFDLAYFPSERGPYNFNTDLNPDGTLRGPARENWAGITRAITNDVDFDNINVEYIEFWLQDPFIQGDRGRIIVDGKSTGTNNSDPNGKIIFNLGNISEDVIRDGKHMFENGLPTDGDTSATDNTVWGRAPTRAFLNNAFEVGSDARQNQDVGLDGLSNAQERQNYINFLQNLPADLNEAVRQRIESDPSNDDFEYFLGGNKDAEDAKIIGRYKNYNNVEGNSPDVTNTGTSYVPVGSTIPDNEDLNRDNTLNELDNYYQYEIPLNPSELKVGNRYIVDKITTEKQADWYLFRIPIREPSSKVGDIDNFKSMRFVRTILTGFDNPVVLRMLNFQLVSSQWRKFTNYEDYEKLREPGADLGGDLYNPSFVVSTVNIEENGTTGGETTPYVLPPGFRRDRDNSSLKLRNLNEQSLRLCVDGLRDGDARAVFKTISFDFLNYKRLKMNIHAETQDINNVGDGDLTAFIRLGTDFFDNYYEVEIPLQLTRNGAQSPEEIWPDSNLIDIAFKAMSDVKVRRNQLGLPTTIPYSQTIDSRHRVSVVGNPDYTSVQIVMIGIRNPRNSGNESPKSVCIWANELRVTDFDDNAGWAATGRINAKLADFATITASGRMHTFGFGGLQDRISERTRDESKQYFISSNVNLDKFFPKSLGLRLPMFVSYENEVRTPKYDPLDRDVLVRNSITRFSDGEGQDKYLKMIQDRRVSRSINFTNVGKVKTKEGAKAHIYDIENLSFTYAYRDEKRSTENIEAAIDKTFKYGIAYNYTNTPKYFEPFKKSKLFDSPFLKAIKDFNIGLGPSTITVRGDLDRRFAKTLFRNFDRTNIDAPNLTTPYYQKAFTFTRSYDVRYNITKNLALDYTATAFAIIDEPGGEISTQENRDSVMVNLMKLGRMKNFDQRAGITYKLPLDKLPVTDWIDGQYRYTTGFQWTAGAIAPSPGARGQADTLGNLISNEREQSIAGRFNLTTLYNKNKFLKDLNKPANQKNNQQVQQNRNPSDTTKQKPVPQYRFLKDILRLMTTVKSVDFNYKVSERTHLPGFLPKAVQFGMDEGFNAPGWDFVFGNQNPGIKDRVGQNGWLAPSAWQSNPFEQTKTTDLSLRAQLEPVRDLKIQLDAMRQITENYSEIFRYDADTTWNDDRSEYTVRNSSRYGSFNKTRNGNYSISIISIKTAFDKDDKDRRSGAFKNFEKFRSVIRDRMQLANPNGENGTYDLNSQDILTPAFLAAYTGKSAGDVALNSFPKIPIPNWRIDYSGLGKLEALKNTFSSFVINHQYSSKLTVGNFVSAYDYQDVAYLNDGFNYPFAYQVDDSTGRFIPFFVFNDVTINEQFSPLIGVNFRTKKRMTGKVEYRTSRAVGLNLSNAQINEQNRKEFVFSFGYTTNNFKVPFKVEGKTVVLKNDLNFRFDVSVSDTKTTQRIIDDIGTITQGNMNVQIRPNVSYVLNQKLQLQIYFERGINTPKVSSSYKRTTTAFGAQLRFSLAQ